MSKAIFLAPVVNAKGQSMVEQIDAIVAYNTEPLSREQRETAQRLADHGNQHVEDVATLHARIAEVEARGVQAYDALRGELQKAHARITVLEARWWERFACWLRGLI